MTDVSTTCAEAIFRVKMASAQVVETSVTNNSPSQDSNHPDHLFQSRYVTPGFKPFSYGNLTVINSLDTKFALPQRRSTTQFQPPNELMKTEQSRLVRAGQRARLSQNLFDLRLVEMWREFS